MINIRLHFKSNKLVFTPTTFQSKIIHHTKKSNPFIAIFYNSIILQVILFLLLYQ